jgi:hypothetical protein
MHIQLNRHSANARKGPATTLASMFGKCVLPKLIGRRLPEVGEVRRNCALNHDTNGIQTPTEHLELLKLHTLKTIGEGNCSCDGRLMLHQKDRG